MMRYCEHIPEVAWWLTVEYDGTEYATPIPLWTAPSCSWEVDIEEIDD